MSSVGIYVAVTWVLANVLCVFAIGINAAFLFKAYFAYSTYYEQFIERVKNHQIAEGCRRLAHRHARLHD